MEMENEMETHKQTNNYGGNWKTYKPTIKQIKNDATGINLICCCW